ncbi:MAG: hypothetical protein L6R41_001238 [Letrouitia leprolyta]|nr:MAG: hypothetical protein L6R41_001238 [Letrouitia leprolyta]
MHLLSILLTIPLIFSPIATGAPATVQNLPKKALRAPSILGQRSPNILSPHIITLSRQLPVNSDRSRHTKSLQKGSDGNGTIGLASLIPFKDTVYFTDITFGTETFKAVVDTGSSDTWLIKTGFQCVTQGRRPISLPEDACDFGPAYNTTPTFKQIPGENFNISYADGELLTGIVGTEDVTLGGITVHGQKVGLVNHAAWNGDNSSSGLIGLAFPGITSVFNGTDPSMDSESNSVDYSPLFTSMYSQGLVAPVFSLAIERGAQSGGLLALGGLPPVQHSPYFACAPLQKSTLIGQANAEFQYYQITMDGVTYGNKSEKKEYPTTVDSGTSLIFLPAEVAYAVNQMFDPPAIFNTIRNEYAIDCASKAPRFGIGIAGHTFYVNPSDLIIHIQDGSCITGITELGYGRPIILGDVFLRNVLAVFDIGASEMRFAAREFY